MIRFRNVVKTYKRAEHSALNGVSLHILPGEFVSIVGQSGTGKTTLVRLLTAEEKATSGSIIVGDWDITDIKSYEVPLLRRQIGTIYQDFKLLPKKTVFENVAYALMVCGASPQHIKSLVPKIIKIVGLEDKMERYPRELSGGEQQRVAIARSLVHKPRILIADEPTGNLDAINTKEIIELLKKINDLGTTVLLVTHDKEVVNSLRKRVVTMSAGEIVSDQAHGRYKL
jgi:cell division transport system ATP-binding protein